MGNQPPLQTIYLILLWDTQKALHNYPKPLMTTKRKPVAAQTLVKW